MGDLGWDKKLGEEGAPITRPTWEDAWNLIADCPGTLATLP